MTEPARWTAAFYAVLINCAEGAHVWEVPDEVSRVLGSGERSDRQWAHDVLLGLILGGFVELEVLAMNAPEGEGWIEVSLGDMRRLLDRDEIWDAGQMADGTLVSLALTESGDHLLSSLEQPAGLSFFPRTAYSTQNA